jgi:hypothetical protein
MSKWLIVVPKLPANGMAIFPFILVKNKAMGEDQVLINHEKIHLRQQLELLILPFYLLYLLHYFYNLIKYQNHHLAYLDIIFEREAYHFDKDLTYLSKRKFLAWTALIRAK